MKGKRMVTGMLAGMLALSAASLSCMEIHAAGVTPNVLISRDQPAYAGGGQASAGNDAFYYTQWSSTPEDYLAYDLSAVPDAQKKQVIAVWYNLSTYDQIGQYVSRNAEPIDYVIEVNKAAGGSYPESGWEEAVSVTENGYSSRQHLISMAGYNWIRLRITKAMGDQFTLNFDVHSASDGVSDSWIMFGDSITAGGMGNAYGTGYATYLNQLDERFYPVQENGGIGGIRSIDGKEHIDEWLKDTPVHFVSIAYGTNDCWGNPNAAASFYDNTKYMIDAILNAGKVPVLPMVPYSTNPDVGNNVGFLNEKVTQLYEEYGSKLIAGPDFYDLFLKQPDLLSGDGVHPSSEGYDAMRQLWAKTMYETVYSAAGDIEPAGKGDINGDGAVTVADAVLLHQYLLAKETDADWEKGDLNEDGKLDARDLTCMKRLLFVTV